MTVHVLAAKYKDFKTEDEQKDFILRHIKKNYVNYEQKITDIERIVEIGNHKEIEDPTDKTKSIVIFKRNTPIMYYFLKLTLLKNYSDIVIESGQELEAYNLLESIGFLDAYISLLPEIEVTKYYSIFDMANNDIYTNERDVASYFDTKIDAFSTVLNMMVSSLGEFTQNLEDKENENN